MYKMIGSQKLGKGQSKLDDSTETQGSMSSANSAKSGGGSNNAMPAGGDAGKQGGQPPLDENMAKKGSGGFTHDCFPGAKNEFTADK